MSQGGGLGLPEDLRLELKAKGYKTLEVGDATLELMTGIWSRTIKLDDKDFGKVPFPKGVVDWDIVADIVRKA